MKINVIWKKLRKKVRFFSQLDFYRNFDHISFRLGLKSSLLGRLGLTEKKLKTLATGIQQIAKKTDVLGL